MKCADQVEGLGFWEGPTRATAQYYQIGTGDKSYNPRSPNQKLTLDPETVHHDLWRVYWSSILLNTQLAVDSNRLQGGFGARQ